VIAARLRRSVVHAIAGCSALAVLATAGCTAVPGARDAGGSTTATPAPSGSPTATPPPIPPSTPITPITRNGAGVPLAPTSYYRQKLTWRDCGAASEPFECSTLRVPRDYRSPAPSIRLAVLRRSAEDRGARIGSLVVNPGGPGASGVEYARYASQSFSADVLRRYDIVGFDPRGVGSSSPPVRCLDDSRTDEWLSMDVSPDTPAEIRRLTRFDASFARSCQRHTGAVLGHVSTVEAAADLDVLRAALGETTLTYFGASYGTLLGATYAQEFPARVGRMVLDGAVSPTVTVEQAAKAQAVGFDQALDALLADCVTRTSCPVGSTVPTARTAVVRLLARLDRHPLPTATNRPLTQQLAENGIAEALYSRSQWPVLLLALQAARRGYGAGLLMLADNYSQRVDGSYQSLLLQANVAINCLDSGPTGQTPPELLAQEPAYREAAPVFGVTLLWSSVQCDDWPVRAPYPTPTITAAGAAPIVVVGTTRDPATPYAWSRELAGALESGVLVTRDGDGHTGYHRGSSCVDTAVDTYLVQGRPPADGTRCS